LGARPPEPGSGGLSRPGELYPRFAPLRPAALKPALDGDLLLQVDPQDEKNGMIGGDCGRLHWMIRRQDLVERRFDRAWFSLQST
jgi:uncharacterized protein YwqG